MNILELEEGIRSLIAMQPNILSGPNAKVILAIKDLIEEHKTFAYKLEEYPEQDVLKVGTMNEISKFELNFTSYVCQVLQERGINIMLYVPKYAEVFNKEMSKFADNAYEFAKTEVEQKSEPKAQVKNEQNQEKYVVVEKQQNSNEPNKTENEKIISEPTQKIHESSQGRDYLMNLLKK